MRVSVIIPTLNRRASLAECLAALPSGMVGIEPYETIVVCGGSDDSVDAAAHAGGRVIRIEPTHFAKAVNVGAKEARGEWLLLLNDDAVPAEGFCAAMLGTATALGATVVGSRTLLPDGGIQQAGVGLRAGDGLPVMLDYRCQAGAEPRPEDRLVAAVCFACAIVRRDVFERVGGLDEGFVNAYEDIDFCLRAVEDGYRVGYHGSGRTTHKWLPSEQDREATGTAARARLAARWNYRLPLLVRRAGDSFIQTLPHGGYSVEPPEAPKAWASDSVRLMEAARPGGERTRGTFDAVRTPADLFHVLATHRAHTFWLGVSVLKPQHDLARYLAIFARLRPACVVETGGAKGGAALFFMDALDALGLADALVVSIDTVGDWSSMLRSFGHPLALLKRDCLDPESVAAVKVLADEARAQSGRDRIVISLDSVHTEEHVWRELELYAPLCTTGDYLVIEDTDHSGHPIMSDYGPSAWHAVQRFLASGAPFVVDDEIERAYGPITGCPRGWLRRI